MSKTWGYCEVVHLEQSLSQSGIRTFSDEAIVKDEESRSYEEFLADIFPVKKTFTKLVLHTNMFVALKY